METSRGFWIVPGELVSFPAGRGVRLDGFLSRPVAGARGPLLVFIHGMHSNFHSSGLKKAFIDVAAEHRLAVLSFNNRGAECAVETERFADCVDDLDGALRLGRRRGFRSFVLVGHSTGCQKTVYYLSRRRRNDVAGAILLAPADDYAICRRDLGSGYGRWLRRARAMVRTGRGAERLPEHMRRFTARRFLSVADPRRPESALFRYAGPMRRFGRLTLPMLAVFGDREEYACIPEAEMGRILCRRTSSADFTFRLVRGGDHGFHGRQRRVARLLLESGSFLHFCKLLS